MHSTVRAASFAALLAAPLAAQITQRVSVPTNGTQANAVSAIATISDDGRFVGFMSDATNLVSGDTNHQPDIFLRDRDNGTTERVTVSTGRAQANNRSYDPFVSADGRFVVFESFATNLVAGDTNIAWDVFVRDRQAGTTERISLGAGSAQANDDSFHGSISADGRYVAFQSRATNLAANDTSANMDVFVRDRQNGTTTLVSVSTGGAPVGGDAARISADGRYIAFESAATNLVAGDTNAQIDVFVRDRQTSTTERVSVATGGAQGNLASGSASISADGRWVAFRSAAVNLVPGDVNGVRDIFVRDRTGGSTERVSISSVGLEGLGDSNAPAISADGNLVAFRSDAANLVSGDTNGIQDVFLRDRPNFTTERIDVSNTGAQANNGGIDPSVSADGRYVTFLSASTSLVPWDTNLVDDVFVRDRNGETAFTSLCFPGLDGIAACPCGNPPITAGVGCDNSAHTGGALLTATGATYLSSDSLVFRTSGEKPTATSILLQGTTQPAAGIVYGQGVRCVGGTLKRLFAKSASGGSVTMPNFGAGDMTVSARSAFKGNVISPGQVRTYLVFYRDPVVLGGCPAGSTFNATQTGVVAWAP